MPFTWARFEAGRAASSSISSSSASRVSTKPCTSMSGISSCFIAAAARLRIVPPMPTSRPPPCHQPSSSSFAEAWARSAFICFGVAFSSGRKRSLTRTAPRRSERLSANRRSSIFIVWMLPPPMSMPKPSSIVVELAIASQP